jgi:L-2-hydroxyglutarate oxidase LhgO
VRIIPFRGEYHTLAPDREHLVSGLIYPVPDPRFPFLGVHFTRMFGGGVECGPNAVLAYAREGYSHLSFRPQDVGEILAWPGFWRMASRYWRVGVNEVFRSYSPELFAGALRKLVPEVRKQDLARGGAGVRAQAVDRTGALLDDFAFAESESAVHVLNAPSPGATASLAIGEYIVDRCAHVFDWPT